mgnify:CR=1 FL=1
MGQIKHTHNVWCKRKIKRPWSRTSFFALPFGAIAPSPWLETALHIVDDADNANGEHFCTHKWVNVSSNTWQECPYLHAFSGFHHSDYRSLNFIFPVFINFNTSFLPFRFRFSFGRNCNKTEPSCNQQNLHAAVRTCAPFPQRLKLLNNMQESRQFIPFVIILTWHHFADPQLVSTIVSVVDLNGLIY